MTRKPPTFSQTMICQRCGSECIRTGSVQKYCRECSEIRDLERKNLWAKNHPSKPEVIKRTKSKRSQSEQLNGIENSNKPRSIVDEREIEGVDPWLSVKVAVPFSYGYSKNAIYSMTAHGHLFLRDKTRALRDEIVIAIKQMLAERPEHFYNAKIYLDIFVEKPNHLGDAVNVVDTVCDAVKAGIGIDDRWFCIRSLDWAIVKQGGRLIIGISQDATEDYKACHRCGRLFPVSEFHKGRHRVCDECAKMRKEITVQECAE